MTTYIDSVYFMTPEKSTLSISVADAKQLIAAYESSFPDCCFLRDIEDELGKQTKEKHKCECGTQSYGNAKFCRECGTKIDKQRSTNIQINSLDWHDNDHYDSCAANTFFPVFINEVVPRLTGQAECSVSYGEDDGSEEINFKTAHFIINNGEVTWCEIQMHPSAEAPTIEGDDPYVNNDKQ
jgi:hypothetical protein